MPSFPNLSTSFRVIVPELPGFGRSHAVLAGAGRGRLTGWPKRSSDAADGEDAIVLGNGYGGFVALQMAIRHPGIADQARAGRLRRGVLGAGA